MGFVSLHNHTEYSNAGLGFPDSTNKTYDLIKRAKDIGLEGIAITDHEILSGHYKALKYGNELGIKVILGNEIYLMDDKYYEETKEDNSLFRYYPHFILLALDEIGHRQLRELSSIAWRNNSYYYKGLLRRPTKYSDIERIIGNEKGHIFASTACIGGFLGHNVLTLIKTRKEENQTLEKDSKLSIHKFLNWCIKTFGKENFAIEIQPNVEDTEQWEFNKVAVKIAKTYEVPFIVTTDSHYLSNEEREIHKALLNSKQEEDREVDEFYATAYLMEEKEIVNYLKDNIDEEDIQQAIINTRIINDRVEEYSLSNGQIVPQLPIPSFTIEHKLKNYYEKYPYLEKYAYSEDPCFRYMLYKIENAIFEKYERDKKILPVISKENGKEIVVLQDYSFEDFVARINQEFEDLWKISEILKQPMPAYYLTMSQICDTIWDEAESLIGASRGSACGLSLCYLLDISQINPLWYGSQMPSWRHISVARATSLPDVDIDLQYSRKLQIMESMNSLFGNENVLQVCTFGTLTAKNALRTAGRGLKVTDPDITDDVVSMFSDLVKVDRGKTYTIDECLYGNEAEEKEPIKDFVKLAKSYPQLIETAKKIEGLIMNRSEHASGVILSNYRYTEHGACMRSQKGNLTTQFNLEDCEAMGNLKYDFLMLTGLEKVRTCLNFLLGNNLIEDQGSLRKTYYKYLAPWNLNYNNKDMWNNLFRIPTLFQFETDIGVSALKLTTPKNILDLSAANSLMRLRGEIDGLNSMQRFAKYQKDINNWYKDMDNYGLDEQEQEIFKDYLSSSRGLCDSQEKIMLLVMDKRLCGGDLKFADRVRKVIAKKKTKDISEIKKQIYSMGGSNQCSKQALDYLWDYCICPSLG